MNRLGHGYPELYPELGPNFLTSPFDDIPGALQTFGINVTAARGLGSAIHVFQTLPGMLSVIVSAVAGAIGALAAFGIGLSPVVGVLLGAGVFVLTVLLIGIWSQ